MLKVFFLMFFFLNNFCVTAAGILDIQSIRDHAREVIDNRIHSENGPMASFRFQQFIKKFQLPLADRQTLKDIILELRNVFCVCGRILKDHLRETNFIKEKILETEIRFLNQFHIPGGTAFNNPNGSAYQMAVDNITGNFSKMVGKITITNGGGSRANASKM